MTQEPFDDVLDADALIAPEQLSELRMRSDAPSLRRLSAHALALACVAEDAFISFLFARNLADGLGPIWNAGEPPVEGYTNFLWVMCSAVWILLGVDPGFGAQLLGVGASLVTLFLLWRAGVGALGWSEQVALLPCLFLALAGPFAAWAAGGLETNLFGISQWIGLL